MKPLHAAVVALAAAAGVAIAATTADANGRRSIKDATAPFSWTGFYAGVHAGYGFASDSATLSGDSGLISLHVGSTTIPPSLRSDLNGLLGGLQVGRNWQLGTVVVGIEADFSGSAIGGSATGQGIALDVVPIVTRLEQELDWLSTVRGRIGVLPTANLLVFATGGLAFGRVEQRLGLDGGGIGFLGAGAGGLSCPAGGALCLAGSSSDISVGWTAGAGFEYAITPRISLKGEYLFVDLGEHAVTATPTAAALATPGVFLRSSGEVELHIVRAGVNVKF